MGVDNSQLKVTGQITTDTFEFAIAYSIIKKGGKFSLAPSILCLKII
jgi:hypothetical protein